jgi:hypothetical protein
MSDSIVILNFRFRLSFMKTKWNHHSFLNQGEILESDNHGQ